MNAMTGTAATSRRAWRLALACLLVLLSAVAACDSKPAKDSSKPGTKRASGGTGATSALPKGVNTQLVPEMLDRLARGRRAEFAAKYDFVAGGKSAPIPKGTLELVQRGEQSKVVLTGEQQAVAYLVEPGGMVLCASTPTSGGWQCAPSNAQASAAPVSLDVLFRLVDQFRPAQYYFAFEQSDEVIADEDAWCVKAHATEKATPDVLGRVGRAAEVCVSEEGAPLVVELEGGADPISVRATEYTTDVDEDTLAPPSSPS